MRGSVPPLPPERLASSASRLLAGVAVATAAALALAWSSADLGARPSILGRLKGEVTLAVAPRPDGAGLEDADAAAFRAQEILAATPGVARADVLDPLPPDRAIGAAMGTLPGGDEGPRLLAVDFTPGRRPSAGDLVRRLTPDGIRSAADDHGPFSGPVERRMLEIGAAGAALAACLVAAFVMLAELAARHRGRALAPRLRLLGRLGMDETRLTLRLAAPVAAGVVIAAGLGAGAAALLQGRLGIAPAGWTGGLVPAPGPHDLLVAAIAILAAAALAVLAALAASARAVARSLAAGAFEAGSGEP